MDHALLFQNILARAKRELNPKLRVGPKSAFLLHSVINAILNLVYPKEHKDIYLRRYTTTIRYTIAMADERGSDTTNYRDWITLCHEIQHAEDARRWTPVLFGFLYLWPLSQGLLLLFFGWIPIYWVPGIWKVLYLGSWAVVVGVHGVPQIPDPWRKHWEMRAYAITLYLHHMSYGSINKLMLDHIAKNFSSMIYYMMDPDHTRVRHQLEELAKKIVAGKAVDVEHLAIVQIARSEFAKMKTEKAYGVRHGSSETGNG